MHLFGLRASFFRFDEVQFELFAVYMAPDVTIEAQAGIVYYDSSAVSNAVDRSFDEGALFAELAGIFGFVSVMGEKLEVD